MISLQLSTSAFLTSLLKLTFFQGPFCRRWRMKECLGLHSQNVADWTKLVYFQQIKKEQLSCAPRMFVQAPTFLTSIKIPNPTGLYTHFLTPVNTQFFALHVQGFVSARATSLRCMCNIFALHMQHLLVARAELRARKKLKIMLPSQHWQAGV